MSECDDCATATERRGAWHCYRASCFGCTTRGVARSYAAWQAMSKDAPVRDPQPLRETLQRLFGTDERYKAAREAVWKWWELDHAEGGKT